MRTLSIHALLSAAALIGAAEAQMHISACSLGCSNGAGGAQVGCILFQPYAEDLLRIEFSLPVDPASITSAAVQLLNPVVGLPAPGTWAVDPADARVLVFTPAPALMANVPHYLTLQGTSASPGPFIRSTSGLPNESPLLCGLFVQPGSAPAIHTYCDALPNSTGVSARIGHQGTASVTNNDLVLVASDLPPNQFGLFFFGPWPTQLSASAGNLCVTGGLHRLPPALATGLGAVARPVDLQAPHPTAGTPQVGTTWYYQLWYRDPTAVQGTSNFSDGLRVTFQP